MRRRWMAAAGLLFLTACQQGTSNDRGAGERRSASDPARSDAGFERETGTARTHAAILMAARREIEMAKLVGQRSQASDVKELASRILEQRTEDIDTLLHLARERSIDLGATETDPLIRADQAAGRDTIDRLTRASGPELDALYLAFEVTGTMQLSRLADQAETLARDAETTGTLRRIGARARDSQARAFAVMPRECGGQRDVRPAAAHPMNPSAEDPGGRADAGTDAGSLRRLRASSPTRLGL
jgi:predicted outer membrane protein